MTRWRRIAWIFDGAWLQRRRSYVLATAVCALALAIALLKPLLSARWSLIDDHESVRFYDESPRHGPSWFFHSLLESEAGSPGGTSRYRPAYYFLRIAETGLWHGSARLWWFAHVASFAIGLALLLWALRRVTAIWENLAVTIWAAGAFAWWGDIYCRLGPSEAYCVPALALYAWAAIAAVQTMCSGRLRRHHAWCGAGLALGGVVAAGGKENMVFLLLPSLYIAARARWRGSRRWITIGCAIHLLFGLFVAIATYVGVTRHGHVYKEDVSAGGRLDVMIAAARRLLRDAWPWIAVAVAAAAGVLVAAKRDRRWLARSIAPPLAVIAFAFIAWLSQVAFYNGWPPHLARYYFPGALAAPVAIYCCYVAAVRAARFYDARAAVIARALAMGFMVWRLFVLDYAVRVQASVMHDQTIDVSKKLRRIIRIATSKPDAPIVCVSNSVCAYEPVHAVQVFLRHAHVTNRVYMIQRFTPSQFAEGSLERSLAETMARTAREGGQPALFPLTQPFADHGGGGCVGVGFGGDTGLADCPALVTF